MKHNVALLIKGAARYNSLNMDKVSIISDCYLLFLLLLPGYFVIKKKMFL